MDRIFQIRRLALATLLIVAASLAACGTGASPTPTVVPSATATPTQGAVTSTAAKYLLLDQFQLFYCDPYSYPIARPDAERQAAIDQFDSLQANSEEFDAIVSHLGLQAVDQFTDEQKLLVFREHNRLSAVTVAPSGTGFEFQMKTGDESAGYLVSGSVSSTGKVSVDSQTTSFNTCPICLAAGTYISTPNGPIPVQQVKIGDVVWTQDSSGARVAATVLKVAARPTSPGQQIEHVVLDDGRTITASPAHPTADGRLFADLQAGDRLDGAVVTSVEWLPYSGPATYDILPSGETGFYWADDVLVGSTLFGAAAN